MGKMRAFKRNEVIGKRIRLHGGELHYVYSPNTMWVINSRRMSWAGNVERNSMGNNRLAYGVLVGKPEGKWRL
jgi:hypothetical protein